MAWNAALGAGLLASLFTPFCSAFAFLPTHSEVQFSRLHARDTPPKLENFQVYPPVLTVDPATGKLEITDGSSNATVEAVPSQKPTCQQVLAVHSFGQGIGHPYVGPYTPPPCDFNRVTWNFSATVKGRQYDRLGSVSFGDIELWRLSTSEPTVNGIDWTYLKDMTPFLSLFKKPNTIIFDMYVLLARVQHLNPTDTQSRDNFITDVYTGFINVTLTASYFTAEDSIEPADAILPISSRSGSQGLPSYYTVPPETASNQETLPRNIKRAVVSVAATGQATEEFWWSNVLQSQINTFPEQGTLPGFSPFREVELLIDGNLAGVAWPFPIIFTGGVVPGLWRPIAGIDAYDLKEDEIDITPWLPLLCDGKSHTFELIVSGLNDTNGNGNAVLSKTTGSNFWVDGKIFLWLDEDASHVTTGTGPTQNTPQPVLHVSSKIGQNSMGVNETLYYTVNAQRKLSFSSTINTSQGRETAFWAQSLTFSAYGNYTQEGNVTVNGFSSSGYDVSSSGYARQFNYPLYALQELSLDNGNLTIQANVNRGKDVKTLGQPVFPTGLEAYAATNPYSSQSPTLQGASLSTTQNGTAFFTEILSTSQASGYGTTTQDMSFSGIQVAAKAGQGGFPSVTGGQELFERHVMAVNASVTEDHETLINKPIDLPHFEAGGAAAMDFVLSGGPGHSSGKTQSGGSKQKVL